MYLKITYRLKSDPVGAKPNFTERRDLGFEGLEQRREYSLKRIEMAMDDIEKQYNKKNIIRKSKFLDIWLEWWL